MKNKIYYIYHIPDYVWSDGSIGKIGCSYNIKHRMYAYKGFTFKILEEWNCEYKASDREIELQKQYGYKVDKIPYWKTLKNRNFEGCSKGGKIGGKKNVKSGHLQNISSKGGKEAAKILLANKNISEWRRKGSLSQVESGMLAEKRKKAIESNKKPILQYDLEGNFIKEYDSTVSASKELNINTINIRAVLKNRWKQTKGYTFKYKE